jgi:hypothetical protein
MLTLLMSIYVAKGCDIDDVIAVVANALELKLDPAQELYNAFYGSIAS